MTNGGGNRSALAWLQQGRITIRIGGGELGKKWVCLGGAGALDGMFLVTVPEARPPSAGRPKSLQRSFYLCQANERDRQHDTEATQPWAPNQPVSETLTAAHLRH